MIYINNITALAHQSAANAVIDYIEQNISEKLDLDQIGRASCRERV